MPFIRGRYHINPIAGQALETAREAEEALAALRQREQGDSYEEGDDAAQDSNVGDDKGPIHRVEIEAAELVPSHSGHAGRGFVARVHRASYAEPRDASLGGTSGIFSPAQARAQALQKPETRVFSDHSDLVDFLQNEFAKDCGQ